MTEKENFMKVLRGETPEWIPRYGLVPNPNNPGGYGVFSVGVSFLSGGRAAGSKDIWGVEYATSEEAGGGAIPRNDKFLLTDIRKWRDVIKAPDISGVDWEAMAKKDLARFNRNEYCLTLKMFNGFFQALMAFMGFSEGLCAMYEEPEEVMALFDYLADFYCEVGAKAIEYYKPDILNIGDDTATAQNPFISPKMYREMVKPFHARYCKPAIERGMPIEMHDCGRCEDSIVDWMDFGVTMWHPAQTMNDLEGIKKKYGNKLVLAGAWDSSGPASWPGASEELVRQAVRDSIEKFAVGGGYAFTGSLTGRRDDPELPIKRAWINDEFNKYCKTFYK